jgi:hypothetical protein
MRDAKRDEWTEVHIQLRVCELKTLAARTSVAWGELYEDRRDFRMGYMMTVIGEIANRLRLVSSNASSRSIIPKS